MKTDSTADEPDRLDALRRYGILDTPPEAALDDLVSLAAHICTAPIAGISLIDESRQWFKASVGVGDLRETSLDVSFSKHALLGPEVLVVNDAVTDERFADNPLVTGNPHIRFYAGVPLMGATGHALGALCVIDIVPRELSPAQLDALRAIGRQVMTQLELRRRTAEMHAGDERLQQALEAARAGTYDWDMVRDQIRCSPLHEMLWGHAPGEFDGTNASLGERMHPDDLVDVRARIARCVEMREPVFNEFRVIWPDGSVHWICSRGEFLFDDDGAPVRMRGTIVEITDRKEVEAKLRLSHERFQLVTRATNDAVWDWNLGSNALWWNEGFEALFGYSRSEEASTIETWIEHIHPDDRARVIDGIHGAIRRDENTWSDEYRFLRSDGTIANILDRGYIIRDADHAPVRMIGAMQDVTARKRAESDAARLALRLTLATDAASIGVWDWDLQSDEWYASPTYSTMLGYEPDERSADRDLWLNRLHPDDRAMVSGKIQAVIGGKVDSYHYEARMRHADGAYRWIEVTGRALTHDEHGRPSRLLGVRVDVTERKRAAEDRIHILERITDAFVALDRDWRFTFVNARAAQLLARRAEDLIGQHVWTEFPESLGIELQRVCEQAMDGQKPANFEEYYAPIDRWLESRIYPSPDGMSIYFHDITDRKQSERHIRRLNRVHAVLSAINQTIVRVKDPGVMLNSACEIAVDLGQFRMSWIGLNRPSDGQLDIAAHAGASAPTITRLRELLGGDHAPIDCIYTHAALTTGKHAVCNDIAAQPPTVNWRADAVALDYRSMVSLPIHSAGEVVGTFNLYSGESDYFDAEELRLLDELAADVGFALEVQARDAERERFERALKDSEDRFRQLAENIQEAFWITDVATGRILYVSPAYETIWGRLADDLYASPRAWKDALHPDDRERIVNAAQTKHQRGDFDETYRVVRPDGVVRWIRDRAFPVRAADGTVVRVVGTAEDITDARQLEEQFRQSQKMEAIGQLAGGVAHDFNNILAAIMMQADLASATTDLPQETRELLQDIKSATQRAADLTRQLLAFSRRQVMQPRDVDLNEVVTDLAKMLQRILGEDVHLQLNLHPSPLMTRADPVMLDQVLMNLAINSRDAMRNGGRLFVETSERTLSASEASSVTDVVAGRYVSLRVRDTGEGIPAEHLPRIFEPFFTTKEPGKGTGLGLATVFGIVRQHGGAIWVESDPGEGATFEVLFRPTTTEAAAPEAPADRSKPRGGSETILVVEDEPSVRTLTRMVLERAGYTVLEAEDGHAALRVWAEERERVDLMLTDMVMPGGLGGRELAARLLAERPDLAVVFTSGYSADIAGKELSLEEGRNFIQKPSGPLVLLETVRRCLESQSESS